MLYTILERSVQGCSFLKWDTAGQTKLVMNFSYADVKKYIYLLNIIFLRIFSLGNMDYNSTQSQNNNKTKLFLTISLAKKILKIPIEM
jgi:hypothetical protein